MAIAITMAIPSPPLAPPILFYLPPRQPHFPKTPYSKRGPSCLATSHSFSRQNISTTSLLTNTPTSSSFSPTLGPCNTDIFTIASPSLAYATTLYFKSGFNVQIKAQDGEPEDRIVIRFRRAVMKAGIFQELKRRRSFENKQDKKKRKTREAARKNSKRLPRPKPQAKQGTPKKEYNYKDDNWELPEGDLPYCKDEKKTMAEHQHSTPDLK